MSELKTLNLNGVFDATGIAPSAPMETLPAGDYSVAIVSSEAKQNKDQTQTYAELTLEVLDGQFQGRKLWDRLNLWHTEDKTRKIAQATLSAICHATGIMQVSDIGQLHNKPLSVKVKVGDYSGNPTNEVKGYKAYAGPVVGAAQAGPGAGFGAHPGQFGAAPAQGFQPAPGLPGPGGFAPPAPGGFGAPMAPAAQPMGFGASAPGPAGFGAPPAPTGMAPGFQMPGQQTAPMQQPAAPAQFGAPPAFGAPPQFGAPGAPAAWGAPR